MISIINQILLIYFIPLTLAYVFARFYYEHSEKSKPSRFTILAILIPFVNMCAAIWFLLDSLEVFFNKPDDGNLASKFLRLKKKGGK